MGEGYLNPLKNVGKLHPIKTGKLFYNRFNGILQISPIRRRVKLLFDSINSVNNCLNG